MKQILAHLDQHPFRLTATTSALVGTISVSAVNAFLQMAVYALTVGILAITFWRKLRNKKDNVKEE